MALLPAEAMMAHRKCCSLGGSPAADSATDFDATTTASGGSDAELSPKAEDFQDIDAAAETSRGHGAWRLVWCSERCHKDENARMRKKLRDAAAEAGAALICFKKADKFANWTARSCRPPYVLLTDWREVKPCFGAMHGCALPLFTLVLCAGDDPKVLARASTWAKDSSGSDAVRVSQNLEPLLAYLRASAAPPQRALSGRPIRSTPTASSPAAFDAGPPSPASAAPAMPAAAWPQAPPPPSAPLQCPGSSSTLAAPYRLFLSEDHAFKEVPPACDSAAPSAARGGGGGSTAAMALVQQVAAGYGVTTWQQLDALLRAAAPDVYED